MVAAASAAGRPLALVLGGSRGLGLLIARELGRREHAVLVTGRDPETLDRATAWLAAAGVPAAAEVCDVSDEAAVEALVARLEQDRPVEVLICVAGIIQVGPLAALSRAEFRTAIDVLLWGPINACLAVAGRMRQRRRGRIGVITSVGGLVSVPHLLPYSTAKFGAVGFARGLRAELAGTGVTVTTVAPGLMRTGSHLHAQFAGNQPAEYGWFALGASLPLVSMDAERAAARIVEAVLRGRAMLVLTPLATVATWVEGVAPSLSSAVTGLLGRLLPRPPAAAPETPLVEGYRAEGMLPGPARRLVRALTTLGSRAASRLNQR